jgi:hypothetical protein
MRALGVLAIVVILVIAAFAFGLININQTKKAEMPAVAVTGGQAPAFDVDTAKVNVGTKETTVEVPTVKVGTSQESVKVPTVAVEKTSKE